MHPAQRTRWKVWVRRVSVFFILTVALTVAAETAKPAEEQPSELVRSTVANEVAAANAPAARHMFRSQKRTSKGEQTKLYIETKDAMAGMLVEIDGHPLTAQQRQAEADHLAWLTGSPDELRKKRAREKEDAKHSLQIVKALPDAFLYTYAGTENSEPGLGKAGDQLVRLKFGPNPAYDPPSRVEQVLEGMEGYLLIDAGAKRIARIDGTLFKNVSFGWGIVGHLDHGGHFRVQQAEVGDDTWQITGMSLSITGRILLFKELKMVSDETFSDFRKVPNDLTFAQGADMLKAEQEKPSSESPAR
jgi:hypothetical protein